MKIFIHQLNAEDRKAFCMALHCAAFLEAYAAWQFGTVAEREQYMHAWTTHDQHLIETGETVMPDLVFKRSPNRQERGREFDAFREDWPEAGFNGTYKLVLDGNGKRSEPMAA